MALVPLRLSAHDWLNLLKVWTHRRPLSGDRHEPSSSSSRYVARGGIHNSALLSFVYFLLLSRPFRWHLLTHRPVIDTQGRGQNGPAQHHFAKVHLRTSAQLGPSAHRLQRESRDWRMRPGAAVDKTLVQLRIIRSTKRTKVQKRNAPPAMGQRLSLESTSVSFIDSRSPCPLS